MSLFYLHQRNATEFMEDVHGAEFPSLEAAVDDAIDSARQLMADRIRRGLPPDGWRFEITDPRGAILAVVPFTDTLSEDSSVGNEQHHWFRIDQF